MSGEKLFISLCSLLKPILINYSNIIGNNCDQQVKGFA